MTFRTGESSIKVKNDDARGPDHHDEHEEEVPRPVLREIWALFEKPSDTSIE